MRVLAKDIVDYGLNPADLIIVLDDKDQHYTVLEGNRRLLAIRALENPNTIRDAVTPSVLATVRKLSDEYHKNPIEAITCVLVKDRNEADHWIELRHMGELDGAGLTTWGSDERERFRARTGKPIDIHTQALNFLQQRGEITSEIRDRVQVTTLRRLLQDPDVRSKLGITSSKGSLGFVTSDESAATALLHVVNEIVNRRINVGDVYKKEQRLAYANSLPSEIVVSSSEDPDRGDETGSGPPSEAAGAPPTDTDRGGEAGGDRRPDAAGASQADSDGGARAARSATGGQSESTRRRPRDRLIPDDCVLNITDERLREMDRELRLLSLETHTNAVSVLFRVFTELSVDSYIASEGLSTSENDTLAKKLKSSAEHLIQSGRLTDPQAVPVRRAAQRDSFLAPSVKLMQAWLHNAHVFPVPSDLRAHWNSLQPWFIALWDR